jgi:hypothetical protein
MSKVKGVSFAIDAYRDCDWLVPDTKDTRAYRHSMVENFPFPFFFPHMVRTLKVHKGSHPVQLTFDEQGLRIEGDLNAAKKCNF